MVHTLVPRRMWILCFSVALLGAACTQAEPSPASPSGRPTPDQSGIRAPKSITLGVTAGTQAMSIMGSTTTSGGWRSMDEVHSNGLVTSDTTSRKPVGRLAEAAPSLDNGSISILADGRMRVAYTLRKGITWQDGAPFSAQDLVFTHHLLTDPGFPFGQRDAINLMDGAEAPDDTTFIVTFKQPFYRGGVLGLGYFWPQPEHILGAAFDKYLADGDPNEVINLPYWTTDYIHLGPYRLTSFDPQTGMDLQAYDGFFLGRPKIDVVHIRTFNDQTTLYSNLLAGTVDFFPDSALNAEQGYQLQAQWQASGAGSVLTKQGITWFLGPQFRPSVQMEPAVLDPRVRAALYRALDREGLSEGLQAGHGELAANSILPPQDPVYEATKDDMSSFSFDPQRAKAELQGLGWSAAADGSLHSSADGHQFHTALSTVPGRDKEIAAMAAYWRAIGLQVDEQVVPAAQVRDLEARAQFPGWDSSANGAGDSILARVQGPAATAATHWTGDRGGYEDPQLLGLITKYRAGLSQQEQIQAMKGISDFWVNELPLLVLYFLPEQVGARTGLNALDDWAGGQEASQNWGTYTRDIYVWDLK